MKNEEIEVLDEELAISWELLIIMVLSILVFLLSTASIMMRKRISVMTSSR